MINCKETVELITDYLEQALLPELEAEVKTHLATCPGCTIYLDQMQQTIQTLRQLTDETVSEETKQALVERFQAWQNSPKT